MPYARDKSYVFYCGAICIDDKEEKELIKTHEEILLTKMGLSRACPRAALHTRKSVLGIGLMKPKILLDALKVKLHADNKRKLNIAGTLI